ncbi:hypothetical protein [Clostridium luticellarii]|jgi:hypothetical protein|uniref:Uncharacterized protein n=1 Tax=Clostridium luticellarii TaxID=1691940 RepID=A0A2T0B2R2_9CLOT|nr:hypothetical protein [Clostridium luticellarii]MCI1944149.1 hypothetical protein [Clostridium luticellarii]MCI1967651.1 hypothetical protein [Clostridium luticellarii]MCI1996347.1 hypothetical protein [Clostridium luticellarii]MCI2039960.1 hypothetical protein [Clostridium luticellarii]PRR78178.1 hypothetical protein CLLU_36760 [Clostridium luticellarii]
MNYYCEEWDRMKIKGKIKFVLDIKNLMLALVFIFIFLVVKIFTLNQFYLLKEFIFYIIYMSVVFSILLAISQLIRWNLYEKFFSENFSGKSVIIKLSEIFIGILSLWIPLGIFYSIFVITPNSYILKSLSFTFNYVIYFTAYIIVNCIFWISIGFIFEFIINVKNIGLFNALIGRKNKIYILIDKRNIF